MISYSDFFDIFFNGGICDELIYYFHLFPEN